MPFKKINDLQVYYEVHGEGDTIILMHHGFGCTKIWKAIYPALAAQGYKIVMFDRRGFGRSERGEGFQEFYESDRYRAESLRELRLLKESLDIGECHIVGQCEGGVVGVDYAAAYPGEVKTLTVASTQCYSDVTMNELNRVRLVNKFKDLPFDIQAKMVDWHGEMGEANYDQFAKYGGAYGVGYFDIRPALTLVQCPTLVLYPDRSSIFDVEQSVAFYRHLPKGELSVFPRCGHNTYEQRPQDYIRTILDFLDRNGKTGQLNPERPAMTCLA